MEIGTNVSTKSILIKIGFVFYGESLQFDFGNCKLKAIEGVNRFFQEGFTLLGNYFSDRKAGELEFFLPLQTESYEQGIAFIAYYLRNADLKIKPVWLSEGLDLKEHLPWEKNMKAYYEKPEANIEHEWFRVLVNKLKVLVSKSNDEDVTTFSFDGNVLEIFCNTQKFVLNGVGNEWKQTATVKTKSMDFLPKRIQNKDISIYIWDNMLHIGNRAFKIE